MAKTELPKVLPYDIKDAKSIFEYSKGLLSKTLRDFIWEGYEPKKGKGGLGQMVENIYFFLETNSNPSSDFKEAGMELKCTPLKKNKNKELIIKERLVCNMINYYEVLEQDFEHSHFYLKCQLMLLLFYLHRTNCDKLDMEFLFSVLWKLPEKDLLIIRDDYKKIKDKIERGEAHLISEGDTEYLGACRKGHKGQRPVAQPNSDILAPKRAFSLKTSYMRTVLDYVNNSRKKAVSNFDYIIPDYQLVTTEELKEHSFDSIILNKLNRHKGKNYFELCDFVGKRYDSAKHKYALLSSRLIDINVGNVNQTEEFKKAGLQLKSIRIEQDGSINESMSFENIDYQEVWDTEDWFDSRLYDIFSRRYLFALFKADGGTLTYTDKKGEIVTENTYSYYDSFFWTMPLDDLESAENYWLHIKNMIYENHIEPKYFNSINHKRFHVRPKAQVAKDLAFNPNGGMAKKYCYWFNNSYVTEIIKNYEKSK